MSTEAIQRPAVLVTGASTGIGYASALALEDRGFRVYAGVRAEADCRRIGSLKRLALVPVMLDVTQADSIAAAAAAIRQSVGGRGLQGLVNNAGVVVAGPLELLPLEEVRRQFEVNVIGPIAVIQAMLPLLRAAKGRIVNISSVNGRISAPYLGPYAASKHALEALSDALRSELRGWGIDVAVIEPAGISTPIWDKSLAAADALSRAADPEALAMYQSDLEAIRTATHRLADTALPVDRVVRAVVHAMTARRPRVRYRVGLVTEFAFRAYKWIPDRIWDWIIRKQLALKG